MFGFNDIPFNLLAFSFDSIGRLQLKSIIFLRYNKPICRIFFAIRRVDANICNKGPIITSKLYKSKK